MKNLQRFFDSLCKFHSVASISLPTGSPWVDLALGEQNPAMRGSRPFIGSTLFGQLEKNADTVAQEINELEPALKQKFAGLWQPAANLLPRLKAQKQRVEDCDIDHAFRLLFLTSGVLSRYVAELMAIQPASSNGEQIATIERMIEITSSPVEFKNKPIKELAEELAAACEQLL